MFFHNISPALRFGIFGFYMEKILIVDDQKANLQLLEAFLAPEGYRLKFASDGIEALEKVDSFKPDLILLDIMMPEMDGFEVCRRIKENKETQGIPVVFVTALSETKERIKGLEAGCDDFLTKPVNISELAIRCSNLLKLKKYRDELFEKNQELQRVQKFKEDIMNMIVHDLKNPLSGILGNIQLGLMQNNIINEKLRKYLLQAESDSYSLLNMITSILDIHRIEDGMMVLKKEKVSVAKLFKIIEATFSSKANREGKTIKIEDFVNIELEADKSLLERITQNLVSNALKHVEKKSGEVTLSAYQKENEIHFIVSDNGAGIPPEYHDKIFEKFVQIETKKLGLSERGLGLTFCKMAVEAHGGRIRVDSTPGIGSKFTFTIPVR